MTLIRGVYAPSILERLSTLKIPYDVGDAGREG